MNLFLRSYHFAAPGPLLGAIWKAARASVRARRRLLGLLGVLLSSLSSAVGLHWAALLGATGCPWGHLCMLFGDLLGAPGALCGWFFGAAGPSFRALPRFLLSKSFVFKSSQNALLAVSGQQSPRYRRAIATKFHHSSFEIDSPLRGQHFVLQDEMLLAQGGFSSELGE